MKAFYAGIIIGLGAFANLAVGGGILGAAIFSFALLTICALQYDLFTGKVGAVIFKEYKLSKFVLAYPLNMLGIAFVAAISSFAPGAKDIIAAASNITVLRIANPWWINILMGIICGMCVQIAVSGWKATKQPLVVMLPVIVFVVGKTNHCIADMYYVLMSVPQLGPAGLITIVWTTIGNIIGAAILSLAQAYDLRKRQAVDGNKSQSQNASIGTHPPHNTAS